MTTTILQEKLTAEQMLAVVRTLGRRDKVLAVPNGDRFDLLIRKEDHAAARGTTARKALRS